jgi:hypothetical protein
MLKLDAKIFTKTIRELEIGEASGRVWNYNYSIYIVRVNNDNTNWSWLGKVVSVTN